MKIGGSVDWNYGTVGCATGSTTFESTCIYPFVASLSSDDFSKTELSIYPNPVSNGLVTIKSQLSGVKNIELYHARTRCQQLGMWSFKNLTG